LSPIDAEEPPKTEDSTEEPTPIENHGAISEGEVAIAVDEPEPEIVVEEAQKPTDETNEPAPDVNGSTEVHDGLVKDAHLATNGHGDNLEEMVNLLEGVNIKPSPTLIASIPDDVAEIPDESA